MINYIMCERKLKCQLLSCVQLFVAPWTIAHHAPLSMEFSKQEYWSGQPFPFQEIFLSQGLKPGLLHCRHILYHLSHQGSPMLCVFYHNLRQKQDRKPRNKPTHLWSINQFQRTQGNTMGQRIFFNKWFWETFPGGSDGKSVCLQCERPGFDPWVRKIPGEGNGNPLQYSCLENPMDGGAWQATVHGVTKSWIRLSNFTTLQRQNQSLRRSFQTQWPFFCCSIPPGFFQFRVLTLALLLS